MIFGAFAGGALADKRGRLRLLLAAPGLFGIAALTMALVSNTGEILINRLIAGIGLGAAAPRCRERACFPSRCGRPPPLRLPPAPSLCKRGLATAAV